jgi:hypothetical protein
VAKRTVHSHKAELIRSSREAALAAIQSYNNPLINFKSETFIVLMMMAWTYLLHAYYRGTGVEYRYYKSGSKRRIFERKDGRYWYWDLSKCLKARECPLDSDTTNNLGFLLGLRHEIEHVKPPQLDTYLSGRYQACALNCNHYLKKLFGNRYALDQHLAYSIQFSELTYQQAEAISAAEEAIPPPIRSYIARFDDSLTDDEISNDRYSYGLLFAKKVVIKRGQANRVFEFIPPESELAQTISREYWVLKEKEKTKYRPSDVVRVAQEQGFSSFNIHNHFELWSRENAKDPAKGYGVEVCGQWYWYERWLSWVLDYLSTTAPETQTQS